MGSAREKYSSRGGSQAGLTIGARPVALGALVLALLLGLAIGTERTLLLVPFLALAGAAVAMWRPVWVLGAIVVLGFSVDYVVYLLNLPSTLTYSVDGLILILALVVMAQSALRGDLRVGSPVLILWAVMLVFALLFGQRRDVYALQSLVGYAVLPLLFLAVINMEMSASAERRIAKILLVLALIQAPVALIQKYGFGITDVDQLGGTLGRAGTTQMATLMAGLFVFLLSYIATHRRWRWSPALLIPIIAMLVSEAKAGFVFAALGGVVVVALLVWQRASISSVGFTLASIVLPLAAVYAAYTYFPAVFLPDPTISSNFLRALFTKEGLLEYMGGYSSSGQALRTTVFEIVGTKLKEMGALPLGAGPGALSTSALFGESAQPIVQGLSWFSSAGRYMLETGLIGLSFFCVAVVHVIARCRGLIRTEQIGPRILGMTLFGSGVIFLAGGFYSTTWHAKATAVSFWVLAGLAFRAASRLTPREPAKVADPVEGSLS